MNKLLPFFLLIIFISSCKDKVTDPIEVDNSTPGSRDYTWEIDTVKVTGTTFTRICGISPNDVWAVGSGNDLDKTIYHFDGKKWSNDGIARPILPKSVFGIKSNDIWLGSNNRSIWHYDGSSWNKFFEYSLDKYNYSVLENIWGDSEDNIYAVGFASIDTSYNGVLFHFDGKIWKEITIPKIKCSFSKIRRATKESSKYYIQGTQFNRTSDDSVMIFEYHGNNLRKIYSGNTSLKQFSNIEVINGKMYFIIGLNIYSYENEKFQLFYQIHNSDVLVNIVGRNKKDIFIPAKDGIIHFNGVDEKYIYRFNKNTTYITGSVIFDSTIFFMAFDESIGANLFFRGSLPK